MKRVILVISNRFQPNVCGFLKEFEKIGGRIDGVLCLQPIKDVKYYLKKPFRFLKKLQPGQLKEALIKIICILTNKQTIIQLTERWNYPGENSWDLLEFKFDIFKYLKINDIPLRFAPYLTSDIIISYTNEGPVIFPMYGGGILTKSLLAERNAEFVNAHMGEMPTYRGMNVIEWAVIEGHQPKVSVMIMNEIIDGGDVIWEKDIILGGEESIADLRRRGYEFCYIAMAEGIKAYLSNPGIREKQRRGGKYYYRMHVKIRELLTKKLRQKEQHSV
jgi:hypothetical protein